MTCILSSEAVFQGFFLWGGFSKYVAVLWDSTHAEVNFSKVAMELC